MDKLKLTYFVDRSLAFTGMKQVVAAEIYGVNNHELPGGATLDQEMKNKQEENLKLALAYDEEFLAQDPIIVGYHANLKAIGRSVKKYPPSALELIRGIQRTGRFPDINPIVNIYNAHVVKNKLSLGVHDMDRLSGPVHFRLSEGGERFVPIGSSEKVTGKGDFLYSDDEKIVAWLYARDTEQMKVTEDTQNLFIIAEGTGAVSIEYRLNALREVCEDIVRCCGGEYVVGTVEMDAE